MNKKVFIVYAEKERQFRDTGGRIRSRGCGKCGMRRNDADGI